MCQLTTEHRSAYELAEDAKAARDALVSTCRRDVELAVQAALGTHAAWRDAMGWLKADEESRIAELLMRGDYCEAGRVMGAAARHQVIERASENAKEGVYHRFGIDIDEESP